ncbi:hypothetical protein ADUPG1_012594, partial [Aduncisulcus paluster]
MEIGMWNNMSELPHPVSWVQSIPQLLSSPYSLEEYVRLKDGKRVVDVYNVSMSVLEEIDAPLAELLTRFDPVSYPPSKSLAKSEKDEIMDLFGDFSRNTNEKDVRMKCIAAAIIPATLYAVRSVHELGGVCKGQRLVVPLSLASSILSSIHSLSSPLSHSSFDLVSFWLVETINVLSNIEGLTAVLRGHIEDTLVQRVALKFFAPFLASSTDLQRIQPSCLSKKGLSTISHLFTALPVPSTVRSSLQPCASFFSTLKEDMKITKAIPQLNPFVIVDNTTPTFHDVSLLSHSQMQYGEWEKVQYCWFDIEPQSECIFGDIDGMFGEDSRFSRLQSADSNIKWRRIGVPALFAIVNNAIVTAKEGETLLLANTLQQNDLILLSRVNSMCRGILSGAAPQPFSSSVSMPHLGEDALLSVKQQLLGTSWYTHVHTLPPLHRLYVLPFGCYVDEYIRVMSTASSSILIQCTPFKLPQDTETTSMVTLITGRKVAQDAVHRIEWDALARQSLALFGEEYDTETTSMVTLITGRKVAQDAVHRIEWDALARQSLALFGEEYGDPSVLQAMYSLYQSLCESLMMAAFSMGVGGGEGERGDGLGKASKEGASRGSSGKSGSKTFQKFGFDDVSVSSITPILMHINKSVILSPVIAKCVCEILTSGWSPRLAEVATIIPASFDSRKLVHMIINSYRMGRQESDNPPEISPLVASTISIGMPRSMGTTSSASAVSATSSASPLFPLPRSIPWLISALSLFNSLRIVATVTKGDRHHALLHHFCPAFFYSPQCVIFEHYISATSSASPLFPLPRSIPWLISALSLFNSLRIVATVTKGDRHHALLHHFCPAFFYSPQCVIFEHYSQYFICDVFKYSLSRVLFERKHPQFRSQTTQGSSRIIPPHSVSSRTGAGHYAPPQTYRHHYTNPNSSYLLGDVTARSDRSDRDEPTMLSVSASARGPPGSASRGTSRGVVTEIPPQPLMIKRNIRPKPIKDATEIPDLLMNIFLEEYEEEAGKWINVVAKEGFANKIWELLFANKNSIDAVSSCFSKIYGELEQRKFRISESDIQDLNLSFKRILIHHTLSLARRRCVLNSALSHVMDTDLSSTLAVDSLQTVKNAKQTAKLHVNKILSELGQDKALIIEQEKQLSVDESSLKEVEEEIVMVKVALSRPLSELEIVMEKCNEITSALTKQDLFNLADNLNGSRIEAEIVGAMLVVHASTKLKGKVTQDTRLRTFQRLLAKPDLFLKELQHISSKDLSPSVVQAATAHIARAVMLCHRSYAAELKETPQKSGTGTVFGKKNLRDSFGMKRSPSQKSVITSRTMTSRTTKPKASTEFQFQARMTASDALRLLLDNSLALVIPHKEPEPEKPTTRRGIRSSRMVSHRGVRTPTSAKPLLGKVIS